MDGKIEEEEGTLPGKNLLRTSGPSLTLALSPSTGVAKESSGLGSQSQGILKHFANSIFFFILNVETNNTH